MSAGRDSGPASFLWQLVWPVLAYDVIREIIAIAAGGVLGGMGTLCAAAFVTAGVLYPVYKRRQYTRGQSRSTEMRRAVENGNTEDRMAGEVGKRGKRSGGKKAAGYALMFLLSIPSGIILNLLIMQSGIGNRFPAYRETKAFLFGAPLWLQLAAMGSAVPLAEEIIFRGMMYEKLRERAGFFTAAAVSAVLFGLSHGNPVQGIYGGVLGLILAALYEHFGGLPAAVLFHVGANAASVLLNTVL